VAKTPEILAAFLFANLWPKDAFEVMKHKDLKPCALCNQDIMHTGLPLFYKVLIQRYGIDLGAVQRQTGLEMMLGGNAILANIMGPDEDMAKPFSDAVELLVCETCAMRPAMIAALNERLV
jgi:hypothetical protein